LKTGQKKPFYATNQGLFYKQLLNNSTSTLCGELRARLHFFQFKKKK